MLSFFRELVSSDRFGALHLTLALPPLRPVQVVGSFRKLHESNVGTILFYYRVSTNQPRLLRPARSFGVTLGTARRHWPKYVCEMSDRFLQLILYFLAALAAFFFVMAVGIVII
jgi:hypothetical protein